MENKFRRNGKKLEEIWRNWKKRDKMGRIRKTQEESPHKVPRKSSEIPQKVLRKFSESTQKVFRKSSEWSECPSSHPCFLLLSFYWNSSSIFQGQSNIRMSKVWQQGPGGYMTRIRRLYDKDQEGIIFFCHYRAFQIFQSKAGLGRIGKSGVWQYHPILERGSTVLLLLLLLRHAQGTPPGFWNGVDWRALVKD